MGLPIFALLITFFLTTSINESQTLSALFYIEAILLLAFSIYFILYIIYNGFDTRVTEIVSKTFTREYLYKYLKKELKKEKEYTLVLISIDNLHDINTLYGIKNGDKVLFEVAKWIGTYTQKKDIKNFPLGHIKGGDFVLGFKGNKNKYNTVLELMYLQVEDFKIDDIEVKISGAITDTSFSNELEYMIENLFEIQEMHRYKKSSQSNDVIAPNDLEFLVIDALKHKTFIVMTQIIFEKDKAVLKECFIKLQTSDGKMIYQKMYMKAISKLGLMLEYDLMVLEKIISKIDNTIEEILVFDISPRSLRNQIFLSKIKDLLEHYPFVKNKIMFMLYENEYYSNIEKYNTIIKSLKKMGILIGIDRLGSIHTSFLYLRDLNIDVVRFDSFYTKEIKNYQEILAGFILTAHKKNVKTWIKLIEDEKDLKLAQNIGIEYLQGKYLAKLELLKKD
ncbi:MAG TPA: GGDEF domain-containing protein [Sulfurimonas sp. UBA12504]|nr:MAG: diguanylate cyclase [Sulfurimonas sp. GWF2_37_8]DAB30486.1 MAG TPA: GGDEF domain-containing protein [Sulfurimonas sp. UBA12504]